MSEVFFIVTHNMQFRPVKLEMFCQTLISQDKNELYRKCLTFWENKFIIFFARGSDEKIDTIIKGLRVIREAAASRWLTRPRLLFITFVEVNHKTDEYYSWDTFSCSPAQTFDKIYF